MEFGKYRLVRKLATGGMAEIFLARQEGMEGFEKTLVIKRILPIHADNDELIDMFLDEARIAATLTHPNIVQIYDLGKCDGEFFIAMEYVHGQDLRRVCERGLAVGNFLPLRHAVRAIADGAAGLYFAHNQADKNGEPLNIVHRDISPQNLLVSFDGVVKILDFGIAKAANKMVTTKHGQLKGKYAYMSPEQCNGLDVDHRSDIFSLGTLLYEITVCTRLFKGDSDVQTIKRVSEAVVPRPSKVRPDFPLDLETIILKALAKDPHDRYGSGLEFQTALEDFLESNRMKTGPVQLGNYMREIFPDKLRIVQPDPKLQEKEGRRPGKASVAEAPAAAPPSEPAPVAAPPSEPAEAAPPSELAEAAVVADPPQTLPIPEIQSRPPLDDPSRVAPVGIATDPAEGPEADRPEISGDHVSFVVNPDAPYAVAPATEFKTKARRRASRSSVTSVEREILSDDDPLDNFERGSRVYYFILALVVLPMLGFGAYLLYTQGTLFASVDSFSHTSSIEDMDVPPEPLPEPLETVLLDLTTEPPGAAVVINGILQSGETPGGFNVVPGTVNTVSLYAPRHAPRHKNHNVPSSGSPDPLHMNLTPLQADPAGEEIATNTLDVTSTPPGAIVFINGRNAGVTPLKVIVTSETEHHVNVRLVDHFDHVAVLYAWPGDSLRVDARLAPVTRESAARFTEVRVQSRDAQVWIDKQVVGTSPHFTNRVRNQVYRLELRRKGYHPYRRVLATTVGSISIDPALMKIVREPGTLTLVVRPKDTQIFVGSTEYEAKELKKLKIPSGKYKVTLVKQGDDEVRGEVEIEVDPGAHCVYEVDFTGSEPELLRAK